MRKIDMDEAKIQDQISSTLKAIEALLARSIEIQKETNEVEKLIYNQGEKTTETVSDLLDHSELTNSLAVKQTDMARERTSLVREQARLSTKSSELSVIRTDLSRERSGLAGQRTDLSVLRTDMSRSRTSLAEQRNKMAKERTAYSTKRTSLAGSRTTLSNIRTSLARGRTDLALIRTGLAFFSIAIAFFRMFGLSWWSLFDGVLALGSVAMTIAGIEGYRRSLKFTKELQRNFITQDMTTAE
jgi:uncharacterized membrane protein YidH (DUF202 family)